MVSSALADRSYRPSPRRLLARAGRRRSSTPPSPPMPADPRRRRTARTACPTADVDGARTARSPRSRPSWCSRFVRKFGTTWGTTDDLRRVTPRVLTLAADHRLDISRSLVWQQLRAARWTTWPAGRGRRHRPLPAGRVHPAAARAAPPGPRRPPVAGPGVRRHRRHLRASSPCGTTPSARSPTRRSSSPPSATWWSCSRRARCAPTCPPPWPTCFPHNPRAAEQLADVPHRTRAPTSTCAAPPTQLAGTPSARRANVAVERLRRFRSAAAAQRRPDRADLISGWRPRRGSCSAPSSRWG